MSFRVKTLATPPSLRARRRAEPEASLRACTADMSGGRDAAGIRYGKSVPQGTSGRTARGARSLLAGKRRGWAQLSLSATFMSLTS